MMALTQCNTTVKCQLVIHFATINYKCSACEACSMGSAPCLSIPESVRLFATSVTLCVPGSRRVQQQVKCQLFWMLLGCKIADA